MQKKWTFFGILVVVAVGTACGSDLSVMPEKIDSIGSRGIKQWRDLLVEPLPPMPEKVKRQDMMAQYLLNKVDKSWQKWQEDYEQIKTPQQLKARQEYLRAKFIEALGGFPLKTPLAPQVTGVLRRPGYRVEKVMYQSRPNHFVTASVFVPESKKYQAPYPGVLVPCGHYDPAKAAPEYQTMGALLALNGFVALVFDPIEQAERVQLIGSGVDGGTGHDMMGVGSILLGRNTATFYLWDGIRSIDYLIGRDDVFPKVVGCTGNSGGGTQTVHLAALDDRIVAAAPSCHFNRLASQLRASTGDIEQHIFGQLKFGMDHADYMMMRAPDVKMLILATTRDFFDIGSTWNSFRYGKRMFTRLGYAERVSILEEYAGHSYGKLQREAVVRWMNRWLKGYVPKVDAAAITEPPIERFLETELQVSPKGQVMLIEGAKSTYDLNEEYEQTLAAKRKQLWSQQDSSVLLDKVREVAGIGKLSQLPKPEIQILEIIQREGYRVEKIIIKPEEGIYLPSLLFIPDSCQVAQTILYLNEDGKEAGVQDLVEEGNIVFAVDIRGIGETRPLTKRDEYNNYLRAHDLGISFAGMRAEDIMVSARYLKERFADVNSNGIALISVGNVGVPALHAAALERQLFNSVEIRNSLVSWSHIIKSRITKHQWLNLVHGALKIYDLPDLALTLGGKVKFVNPVDATGCPIGQGCPPSKKPVLLHRWSFNGNTEDSVGDADVVLKGGASIRKGSLDLSGNSSGKFDSQTASWAQLPIAETLNSLDDSVSIETWVKVKDEHKKARLLSCGSSERDQLYLYTDYHGDCVLGGINSVKYRGQLVGQSHFPQSKKSYYIVITFDKQKEEVKIYIDGFCRKRRDNLASPADVENYTNCFLGRHCDQKRVPFWCGYVDELRIYDGVLRPSDISKSFDIGPNKLVDLNR